MEEEWSTCKISKSFLKAVKRICHLQILIGVLYMYMQLIVCTAIVLACFFVYSFVYFFIYYSLYISSLCVFVCICLFITTLILQFLCCMAQPLGAISFCYFWVAVLSFFHSCFLLMSLHFLYQDHNKDCCCCCCRWNYILEQWFSVVAVLYWSQVVLYCFVHVHCTL